MVDRASNFFKKIKPVLQLLLKKFEAWNQAGHLSPRLWGGLLVGGVFLVFWLAQSGLLFYPALPEPLADQFDTPPSNPIDYQPLADASASASSEILPLATITPISPSPTPTPIFMFHTIQEEDTLISIAAEYGITTEALLAANDIRDPTHLRIGQKLLIPPQEGLRVPVVLHQIEPGDTLLGIASKYGSSLKDIVAANPGLKSDSLPVGQTVAVPIIFNQAKPVSQPETEGETVYYTVQRGDIPLTIAEQFNIPVAILLAVNDITDPTLLQVGQQLLIPPYEGITLGFPVILYELGIADTLLGLASKYGSSVKDILAINPDLIPSSLQPGQIVAIPIIFAPPQPLQKPDEGPPAPIEASPPFIELQQQMVEAVNVEREAHGLPPYQMDEQLTAMAVKHAQDMVIRGFFSHVSPEGNTLRHRFEQQGITDAYRVGENIQRNTRPQAETVRTALQWFMGSRPHRNNILHEYHNRIGIGIVEGPPGWYTFVLDFAQR